MYSIAAFGRMITDEVRMGAYEAAIRASVSPGAVVLDIGAGTGIMSLLACRAGARKVFAVEVGDAIAVAAEIARDNGLADRIEFIQAKSTDITLSERADVIVSDLRGVLPLLEHHVPSIADARRRHLAPGGILIPQRDDLRVAVIEAPREHDGLIRPWAKERFGLDMVAARRVVTNTWDRAFPQPEQLLGEPAAWVTLDYTTIESTDVGGTVQLTVERPGLAHGLAVWFDTVLSKGIGYSNAPGMAETVYGAGFFPFTDAIAVAAGDRLEVTLRADLVGIDYVWTWNTSVFDDGSNEPRMEFRQSTFFGGPLPLEKIRKRGGAHIPVLNREGEIDAAIVRAMTGKCSVEQIVDGVLEQFPEVFRARSEAMARVSDLSERYSR